MTAVTAPRVGESRWFVPVGYRSGMGCPECGRSHWSVGRFSVECAGCGVVLPLREPLKLVIERQ